MPSEETRDNVFTCRACGYTAPVRAGAGWSNCPRCGSDEVTSPPAETEPAAAAEPAPAETAEEGGA